LVIGRIGHDIRTCQHPQTRGLLVVQSSVACQQSCFRMEIEAMFLNMTAGTAADAGDLADAVG